LKIYSHVALVVLSMPTSCADKAAWSEIFDHGQP
jgi:hypothetical protein